MGREEAVDMERALTKTVDGVVRAAKLIQYGDEAIFDLDSRVFAIRTVRDGRKCLLLAVECPWIKEQTTFTDFAMLMGLNAEPQRPGSIQRGLSEDSLWKYRYL